MSAASAIKTYSADPTRTLTLRRRFAGAMRKRFRKLRGIIRHAIVTKDVFGIAGGHEGVQGNVLTIHQGPGPRSQAFDFPRTNQKVSEFMEWLEQQVDAEILEVTDRRRIGQSIDQTWQNIYIEDTYKRGVQRATYEMDRAGWNISSIAEQGGIGTVMSQPAHVDRLGVLYTRSFNELKGITDAMGQQISRVLTQSLADGDGMRLMARKLNKTISGKGGNLGITDTLGRHIPAERRAQLLARTETIRAHHQGMMQTYRNWDMEGIKVKAELRTAGDGRVCPECDMLEGQFFTLKQAQHLIPVHPQCRCIALPARPEDVEDAGGSVTQETAEPQPIPASEVPNEVTGEIYQVQGEDLDIDIFDQDIVDSYKQRIQNGETFAPSFVNELDSTWVVDGNHRAAAYFQLDMPVPVTPVDRIDAITELGTGNLTAAEYFASISG